MGLQVFSTMPAVVESLLTNRPEVASQCLVLLIGMFTDVMLLEVLPSLKASVAHLTRKAARLTGVSPCLLGGGEGGGSGKSVVTSVGQAAESPSNTASWCIFMCLPKWSFL